MLNKIIKILLIIVLIVVVLELVLRLYATAYGLYELKQILDTQLPK